VAFEKSLCRLGRKSSHEAIAGVGQIEGHEMRLALHAGNRHLCFAEVRLPFARRVAQRHEHLLTADLGGARVIGSSREAFQQ
jgi:hypothetical protein